MRPFIAQWNRHYDLQEDIPNPLTPEEMDVYRREYAWSVQLFIFHSPWYMRFMHIVFELTRESAETLLEIERECLKQEVKVHSHVVPPSSSVPSTSAPCSPALVVIQAEDTMALLHDLDRFRVQTLHYHEDARILRHERVLVF
ncbi:hypothetical protein AMTR_s00072p00110590 [Amborella trichopoda]|uniref:Uncharacterized protein n=1 Tax=Amborella trichopoda TaxID=13333 RepID=W1NRD7_AMBTC|nr:hypothetical protein AMTR_s00072p00110590 [Amborella trichopoda]